MLLSFAQFEREVTGERIRDKIAASKMKGMWMGGFVPLGYEPNGRTLTINEAEAETVRSVFRLYLEHGNVRRVKEEADRLGLTTKVRNGKDGRMRGGRPMSRGYIYKMLGNPLYVGRIAHKEMSYDGQHPPIIDTETWDAVQRKLAVNACDRPSGNRATDPSPLLGKLFDETGVPLTPSHAVKSGRRYRYYVSKRLISGKGAESNDQQGWRLPAQEIKRIVGDAVTGLLSDRATLTAAARKRGNEAERIHGLLNAVSKWRGKALDIVERVDLRGGEVAIVVSLKSLGGETGISVHHVVQTQIKRRGVELRLVLEDASAETAKPDPALMKSVARARNWFDDLLSGHAKSLRDIAKAEAVTDRYVSHLMPLAFLAPEIVEAILAGTQPFDVTAEMLTKHTNLPLNWLEQTALLQFN